MKRLLALLLIASPAFAQAPIGGSSVRVYETNGGGNYVEIGPITALSANRTCTLEDDSTPFDQCVSGGSGDITDVWGCSSGDCQALTAGGSDTLDAGGALSTNPCKEGTSAPATCAVGECFFDTDATAGSNIQLCTATNTWTAISGGGVTKYHQTWTANQLIPYIGGTSAALDTRNGHMIRVFPDSATTCIEVGGKLRGYAGGGLTVVLEWLSTGASINAVGWLSQFERHDTGTDLDADSLASAQSTSATTNGTIGAPTYTSIAHTNGVQIDSLATGESFRWRGCRDGTGATVTDSMTSSAELKSVEVYEP